MFNNQKLLERYNQLILLFWILLIAVLPITSMPFVAQLLESDTVASPAILFLFTIIIFWLIPFLFSRGALISEVEPILVFFVFSIISILLSYFREIPPYKGISYVYNNFQALATLIIGISSFIVASTFLSTERHFYLTIKIINFSGMVMLLWAGIQLISWHGFGGYPQWMFDMQGLISSRVLYRQRVNALALEPSWFAHQLNMLYLPIWLAATIKRFSVHKLRIWKITIENLLLLGGVVSLFFTLSRVGLLSFILMFIYFVIQLHNWLRKKIRIFLSRRRKNYAVKLEKKQKETFWISLILIFVYITALIISLYIFSKVDPRMASVFDFSKGSDNALLRYFNNLRFGERIVYWLAGWDIFARFPIFGVGLGNAGYYFKKIINPYGWNLIEVRQLFYRSSILLNIKSLWVRLLAETGLIGFSLFIGWLIYLGNSFIANSNSERKIKGVFSLAGLFVIFGLIGEGFSIDSFALPYFWITLGSAIAVKKLDNNDKK